MGEVWELLKNKGTPGHRNEHPLRDLLRVLPDSPADPYRRTEGHLKASAEANA